MTITSSACWTLTIRELCQGDLPAKQGNQLTLAAELLSYTGLGVQLRSAAASSRLHTCVRGQSWAILR